jgi:hypothetical protein
MKARASEKERASEKVQASEKARASERVRVSERVQASERVLVPVSVPGLYSRGRQSPRLRHHRHSEPKGREMQARCAAVASALMSPSVMKGS